MMRLSLTNGDKTLDQLEPEIVKNTPDTLPVGKSRALSPAYSFEPRGLNLAKKGTQLSPG